MAVERSYKYLNIITVCFVVALLIANLAGCIKIIRITIPFVDFSFSCTTGLLLFPATYLIGDLLTEVYGYAQSRRVIWTGFGSLITSNLIIQGFVALPPDPDWGLQESYQQIFNQSFRVSMASMVAFFCGEFTNSYVVAKLKVITKGKMQWLRIIGSTVAGELVDTLIIFPLGFLGAAGYPISLMIGVIATSYIFKVCWEILAYPLTRQLIAFLKRSEVEDYYDYDTNFSPFHLNHA